MGWESALPLPLSPWPSSRPADLCPLYKGITQNILYHASHVFAFYKGITQLKYRKHVSYVKQLVKGITQLKWTIIIINITHSKITENKPIWKLHFLNF